MLSQHGLLGAGLFCVRIKEKRNSFILCCTGKNFYIVAQQNSDLAGYKFGKTTDGQPGYIAPGGADTVIPFKSHTIFDASVSVGSSDASSVTVPLINYYPNYSKITAANIFVKYKSGTLMGYAKTGGSSISSVLGLSYNNSTGNLTISNAGNNTAGGFYYYRGSTQVFTICIVP